MFLSKKSDAYQGQYDIANSIAKVRKAFVALLVVKLSMLVDRTFYRWLQRFTFLDLLAQVS